jgi:hypothetical protein
MTIDYRITAHECAEALILAAAMTNEIWNDGSRWWVRNVNSQWETRPLDTDDLRRIADTLPDDTYWSRLRRDLTARRKSPRAVKIMREACLSQLVRRPYDLNLDQQFAHYGSPCLCWTDACEKPERLV